MVCWGDKLQVFIGGLHWVFCSWKKILKNHRRYSVILIQCLEKSNGVAKCVWEKVGEVGMGEKSGMLKSGVGVLD